MLPNLERIEIESCKYTAEKGKQRTTFPSVPSPSDTWLRITGSAVLTADAFRALRADSVWETLRPDQIPAQLGAILPTITPQTSEVLNGAFSQNATFTYGIIVSTADDPERRIYFIATDRDHPLE
jgi:hypothetical protein